MSFTKILLLSSYLKYKKKHPTHKFQKVLYFEIYQTKSNILKIKTITNDVQKLFMSLHFSVKEKKSYI